MLNNIKLIVGLANPGYEYALTRHNAGAWYVKLLAKKHNELLKKENKFFGDTAKINLEGNNIRLLIPTIFMNISGTSVVALASFYRIKPAEILVAHDELCLMPGIAKIKIGGSNGGHNGIKDIHKKLGNNPNFYRLRIGIGHPGDKDKVIDFVLNKPTIQEKKLIDKTINEAINFISVLFNQGMNKAVHRLHTFKASN